MAALSLSSASQWLNNRGVTYSVHQRDRELMGLLVAARGNGLAFISADLAPDEWLFTLLHEVGHFMLDHLVPRSHIMKTEPGLLDVFDGDRPATSRDHAISLFGGVDIGVHAHLLDRDDRGYASTDTGQHEDQASDFALEFLAPMRSVLSFLRESLSQHWNRAAAVDEAEPLLSSRYSLPRAVARLRAIEATQVLEIPNSIIDP
jgi:Zn-dependent peptidase ImmA (M78 family)